MEIKRIITPWFLSPLVWVFLSDQTLHMCQSTNIKQRSASMKTGSPFHIFFNMWIVRENMLLHDRVWGRIKAMTAKPKHGKHEHGEVRCSAVWTACSKPSSFRIVRKPINHWVGKFEFSATLFLHRQPLAGVPPLCPLWEVGALQAKTTYFLDIL